MANINKFSPDGGATQYDFEDTPVRSSIARTEDGTSPSAKIDKGEEFYHLNVLYTATADIATTDTITPNTNCRVSDSVTGQIASTQELIGDTVGWTGKNLLKITATSGSAHNIVYTVYDNGTVNCNGYSDAASNIILNSDVPVTVGETYILSDGLDVHNSDRYLEVRDSNGSLAYTISGDNVEFTATESTVLVRIHFGKNKTLSNVLYKPMIRRADMVDDTFEPYHAPIEESKADNSVIGNVENGATCANPNGYKFGEHFQRNGKFCTCKADTAQGETWTLNTNYVEGSLGDIIYRTYKTANFAVTAGGYQEITLPTISGYDVFIADGAISGTGSLSSNVELKRDISTNKIDRIYIVNTGDTDRTGWRATINIMYVKSDTVFYNTLS